MILQRNRLNDAEFDELKLFKEFTKTWDINKNISYNSKLLIDKPKEYDTVGGTYNIFGCQQPGYTGQYCEFPICETSNYLHYDHKTIGVLVDFIHQTSCNQIAPLYVDVSMFTFSIEIHSPGREQPDINLYSSNGTFIKPYTVDSSDPTRKVFQYSKQLPGVYQMIPKTSTPKLGCFVYVTAIAHSFIDVGFVASSMYDSIPADRNDYPKSNPYLNQHNTIVAHTVNVRKPGGLSVFTIYEKYNIMTKPQKTNIRYGCEYDYYYSGLYCMREDYYYMKIEGYDFFGNSFSRIKAFACIINPNPPTPPTTQNPFNPQSCQNGGTLIRNKDNTTYCYCSSLFTSYDCSERICLNDGEPLDDGTCLCDEGFEGDSCQDIICPDEPGIITSSHNHQPIFVIRLRKHMLNYIKQLSNQIKKIAHDLENVQDHWFKYFGLILFNNNGAVFDHKSFDSSESFVQYLLDVAGKNNDDSGECSDNVFSSILTAINEFQPKSRSPIYVLTDAVPNDKEYFDMLSLMNSYYQAPIYIFMFPDLLCTLADVNSPEWKKMRKLSERFSGNIFVIYANEANQFESIFYNHMSNTYFKTELMYSHDLDNCKNFDFFSSLAVDTQFDRLSVITTGVDLSLSLVAPDGTYIAPTPTTTSTAITIWTYDGLQSGQWQFSVISHAITKSCSVRIYSVITINGHTFTPHFRLYWAFTNNLNLDVLQYQPTINGENSLVAHLENYQLKDPTKVNAEIVVHSKTGDNKTMLFASNGIWRDGCKFQMYFHSFNCYTPDETLYFTFFVRGLNGFNIQRAGSMYCAHSTKPTQPPQGECQNGGFHLNNTCICRPQYTGKYCENPICLNGGKISGGVCSCPPLVEGQFCEFLTCPGKPITPEPIQKQQSLTFLLDTTYTNRLFLKQLATYSDVMLRDIISHDAEYIDGIYVVGFNDDTLPMIIGMTDVDNIQYINRYFNEAYNISLKGKKECVKAKTWLALNLARMLSEPNSQVFLFQSSLPEENSDIALEFYTNVYEKFIENRLTLTTYIGAVGKGQYYCSGGRWSFLLIKALAQSTYQGDYLEISYPSYMNVPKVVPSFVNRGIAYKKYFNECYGNCSLYFSVDSQTQNIQVKVKGNVGGYDVIFVTPDQKVDNTSYKLIDDEKTGIMVAETRKECDDDWHPLGPQYCIKYTSTPTSWIDAYNDCMNDNAFLVDILYPAKESYLTGYLLDYGASSIWLGLTDMVNYSDNGTWTWNHGPLVDIPLTSSHFTNWNPNAVLNDSTRQCAYKVNTWNTDNCLNLRPYICQKHTYQDTFSPTISESEKLPPGKWNIKLTSTGVTSVEVRVQSTIRLISGFLTDIHGDTISYNANLLKSDLRMATHVSGNDDNMFQTYIMNSRMFYLNNTMFESVNYQPRLSCTYQYLSQIFSCPKNDYSSTDFYTLTTGFDGLGYTIQRYTTHKCVKEYQKCNHGFIYQNECICEDSWTGDACDIPICRHNSHYNSLTNTCSCKTGYNGKTCDDTICFNRSPIKISRDGKIFALVIENTQENLKAIKSLRQNISMTLKSLHPKWFDQYIYVLFDSTNKIHLKTFFDVDHFITSIQTIVPQDDTTSCSLPVFYAIVSAFGQLDQQQSVVYTITRAIPYDINNEYELMENLEKKSPQFYYHFVTEDSGCSVDMNNDVVLRLQQYTIGSGGNLLITTGEDIGEAFSVIIPSIYHGSPLSNPTLINNSCSDGITTYVHVSRNTSDIYMYIYGQYATVKVISPTLESLQPRTVFSGQLGMSTKLFIYQVPVITDYGMYTVTIQSNGNCYAQIRSTGSPEIYYGFVPSSIDKLDIGNHLDNATTSPFNEYNQIVGNIVGDIGKLEFAQMYNSYSKEYQYLKFYRRENCTYHYFSEPFQCKEGQIYLIIYGRDNSGFVITRDSIVMCTQYIVPPTYQPTTTTTLPPGVVTTTTTFPPGVITTTTTFPPGVITTTTSQSGSTTKATIYLINDVSSNVPAAQYSNTLTTFLMQFFNNFQVNPNYVNVAFAPSPGDLNLLVTLPAFDSFTQNFILQQSINASYYPIEGIQSPGQSQLEFLIGESLDANFINTGYRGSQKPHWLIYLTTKSIPSSGAIQRASEVKQKGVFKIIAIAYQPSQNVDQLKLLSDCFYGPNTVDELSQLASQLANKVNVASAAGQEGPC